MMMLAAIGALSRDLLRKMARGRCRRCAPAPCPRSDRPASLRCSGSALGWSAAGFCGRESGRMTKRYSRSSRRWGSPPASPSLLRSKRRPKLSRETNPLAFAEPVEFSRILPARRPMTPGCFSWLAVRSRREHHLLLLCRVTRRPFAARNDRVSSLRLAVFP